MAGYFFDTSALVKRYRQEQGTDVVDAIFAEANATFIVSRLGVVETISALAMKVRSGELAMADYSIVRKKFLGEIAQKTIQVVRLLVGHYRQAEKLIDKHSPTRRLRTLDALQLSITLELQKGGHVDTFVCADIALCEVAELEGLVTKNPLAP